MSAERAERERIAAEALRASLWATLCDHEESDPYDAAGPNGGLVIVPTDTVRALCDAADEVERLRAAVAERDTRLAETVRYHDARVNRADEATDASRTAHAALVADLRALHAPFPIYDRCDCPDPELGDDVHFTIREVGTTCERGREYVICRECCTDEGEMGDQTEECATYHDHGKDDPHVCATAAVLDRHAPEEGR